MSQLKKGLRKRSQKPQDWKIYGFDIETYGNKNKFYCASIYYDENNYWVFYDVEELKQFLKTKRFWKSYIVATNLGFDFYGTFNHDDMKNFDILPRGSNLITATTKIEKGEFIHPLEQKNKKRNKTITFIDTGNYAKVSVENLGKVLGLPKLVKPKALGKLPKNEKEKEELVIYNIRDSEISKKAMEFMFDSFRMLGADVKPTIAGTALSLFKNRYVDETFYVDDTWVLNDLKEAYFGGRTEAFGRGKLPKENTYYMYDFISMYPFVMKEFSYPHPNYRKTTYKNTTKYIEKYMGVSKVDVFIPEMMYPPLPYRTKTKLLFPCGHLSGSWSHAELNEAIRLGCTIKKVHKTHYYTEECTPFKGYVEDLYKLKKQYKEENNPMVLVVKLLLNSLYGKFGQRWTDVETFLHETQVNEEHMKIGCSTERIGDTPFFRFLKDKEPSNFNINIWGVYITSYARIHLRRILERYNGLYCDTDSLITDAKILTGDKLGDLELELVVKDGYIVKPKCYSLYGDNLKEKVRLKGAKTVITMKDFIDFMEYPHTKDMSFVKFKEALRSKGKLSVNQIVFREKFFSLEDEKRVWPDKFDSNSFQISKSIIIEEDITENINIYKSDPYTINNGDIQLKEKEIRNE